MTKYFPSEPNQSSVHLISLFLIVESNSSNDSEVLQQSQIRNTFNEIPGGILLPYSIRKTARIWSYGYFQEQSLKNRKVINLIQ